ncbi:MAG: MBL fold metallo-hydrolase [Phycisphaerae bacterium]|nr:MBL fold metallo-hydrolase [Phycisphaerae bacterium]NUQ45463.1 MBL fold metallo-hydrolase [Phycisphaerae bacterium]
MAQITEIAPSVHRISILFREINLQFNHFLVVDDEPLLYHTGMRRMFPDVLEAVRHVIDPATLRWIGFGHFEVDECGALNEWLKIAPHAQAVSGVVGSLVNLSDFADRPPRALNADETFSTGRFRYRYRPTPHLPHGWDAGALFEETQRVLFCSDLFTHNGDVEPLTESDILGRTRQSLVDFQAGPLLDYMPYTPNTRPLLEGLAALRPRTLAIMHGSSFTGDGSQALIELDGVMKEMLGRPTRR